MSKEFEKWTVGFSGCDGGDMGSPQKRSIWICGIEWGGSHNPEELLNHIQQDDSTKPSSGYEDWKHNLAYRFNWQVMKLLSAIDGRSVEEYSNYAKEVSPFVKGVNGYFKMNLYPIAFKNTDHSLWQSAFKSITGFESKQEYLEYCKKYRLPAIRGWTSISKPKLIICLGKTYIDDFTVAFFDEGKVFTVETFENRELRWGVNATGSLVVVLSFMSGRHGLVKNSTIQLIGERISQLFMSTTS